jgi:hypothetical protein
MACKFKQENDSLRAVIEKMREFRWLIDSLRADIEILKWMHTAEIDSSCNCHRLDRSYGCCGWLYHWELNHPISTYEQTKEEISELKDFIFWKTHKYLMEKR